MDIWRLSHLFESAGKVMVAFNADTMAWPCHGRIRSWPWSDPSLMGLGDEGPGSEGGPGGDLRPREPPRKPRGVMSFEKKNYIYI